jgi:phosphoribosyl-AMP cyclohydrolase
MVCIKNEESSKNTDETGCDRIYTRTRNNQWMKCETSGHKILVKEALTDCDTDTVLLKVEALGPGVCHEGYMSCFFRTLENGEWKVNAEKTYDPKAVY